MALTVAGSNTQACTINTEHSLITVTGPKSVMLVVDPVNFVAGDEFELRAKVKVLSAGTRKLLDMLPFQNAQPEVIIFGPFPAGVDIEFTIKQTLGTGRNVDWAAWAI